MSLLASSASVRAAWCAMVLERQLVLEQTGIYIVTGGPDDGKVLLPPKGMQIRKGAVEINHGLGEFAAGIAVGGASFRARRERQ